MAAADITLNDKIATIECDDAVHKVTVESAGASIVNIGVQSIFISMIAAGALYRDGLQHDGELELGSNDSIPLPAEVSFFRHQCASTLTSKLWFIPRAG